MMILKGFFHHTIQRIRSAMMYILLMSCCSGVADLDGKPNILFIATDDLRVELGCYGQHWIRSPNIDKLANRGTMFTRAYSQAALCNPSRVSLMTGLYPDTIGVIDLSTNFREIAPDVVTLPQYLKMHGYFTQNIGKIYHNWHRGGEHEEGDSLSWSIPAEMHYARHKMDVPTPQTLIMDQPDNEISRVLNNLAENYDVPDNAYFDGRIAEKAVAALERFKDVDQPFFLAIGFWKPHLPFNAPKKYWDYYLGNPVMEPLLKPAQGTRPAGMPEIAAHSGQAITASFENGPDEEQVGLLRQGYYAAVSYLDAQVGKVLDALDRLDLEDETIVVFWSDHGFHLGEKALWCKNSCYDLDTRVPLIIRTPGQKQGQVTNSLVELIDLYPTLLDFCGLPVVDPVQGQPLQGKSLVPVLENPEAQIREAAFSQIMRPAYSKVADRQAMGYTIRVDKYRFAIWVRWSAGMSEPSVSEILAEELYDLQKDPREVVNLAGNPEWDAVKEVCHKQFLELLANQKKGRVE